MGVGDVGDRYVEGCWGFPALKKLIGVLICVFLFIGFLIYWFLGSEDSWFLGFKESWTHGFLFSKVIGFLMSKFLGFVVPWLLGFKVYWFLGFEVSKIHQISRFLIAIHLMSKIFTSLLNGSPGFVGPCLFQMFQKCSISKLLRFPTMKCLNGLGFLLGCLKVCWDFQRDK